MKNKETIDVLVKKMRQHQPQLQNEKELTDKIMKTIEKKPRKKVPRILTFVQTFSGVAAVLLGILFVFQATYERKETTISSASIVYNKKMEFPCNEILKNDKSNLKDVCFCYLQQNTEKKELLENLKNKFN